MKSFLLLAFVISLVKSGLWISIGIIVKNYFVSLFVTGLRQSEESAPKEARLQTLAIGLAFLLISMGILVALTAILSLAMGARTPLGQMNFKF